MLFKSRLIDNNLLLRNPVKALLRIGHTVKLMCFSWVPSLLVHKSGSLPLLLEYKWFLKRYCSKVVLFLLFEYFLQVQIMQKSKGTELGYK